MAILHTLKGPLITLAVVGIIGFIAYVYYINQQFTKHRKEIVEHVKSTFLDPATSIEETVLCRVVDKYKVIPPGGENGKKAKPATTQNPMGYYLLFGAVKKQPVLDDDGNDTGKTYSGRVTTLSIYPEGKSDRTQVQVEHAYYVKGDPRPRNPYNSWLPVNSDEALRILADNKALEAIHTYLKYDIEALLRMVEDVKATAKNMKYLTFAVIGSLLASGVAVIIGIMILRKF